MLVVTYIRLIEALNSYLQLRIFEHHATDVGNNPLLDAVRIVLHFGDAGSSRRHRCEY